MSARLAKGRALKVPAPVLYSKDIEAASTFWSE